MLHCFSDLAGRAPVHVLARALRCDLSHTARRSERLAFERVGCTYELVRGNLCMKRVPLIFIVASAVAGSASGYYLAHAQADEVSGRESLAYSGTLNAAGAPVDGAYQLTLRLFASATPTADEQPACAVGPLDVRVTQGRFSLDASACAAALHGPSDLYSELTAKEGDKAEVKLGRSKIGATPFALEARRAVVATQASHATGDLEAQLTAVATRLTALEASQAVDDLQAQLAAVSARLGALEAAARNTAGALEVRADLVANANEPGNCLWTDVVDSAVVGGVGPAFSCPDGRFVAGIQLLNTPGTNASVDMVKLRCCEL